MGCREVRVWRGEYWWRCGEVENEMVVDGGGGDGAGRRSRGGGLGDEEGGKVEVEGRSIVFVTFFYFIVYRSGILKVVIWLKRYRFPQRKAHFCTVLGS